MSSGMKKYKFEAKIQAGAGGGAFIFFPFNTEKEFGVKGRVQVKATLDGVPDESSLFKYRYPQHLLAVPKAIRQRIGKEPGDIIEVVLWKDDVMRTLDVPAEFRKSMEKEKVLSFFENLSYTHRKEYVRWITEAKKEETRRNRLERAIALLKKNIKTPV
jgi:bifunctional DNA-binding transcriptional regulator/antitoxin component of YhaV-PrlF toxin-antitoxin module